MAQRYVRIKTTKGQTYYGLLQLSRSIQVLDAPPWLQGQPTDLELEPGSYELLAPCAPTKIVAVGKNYTDHAQEMGTPVPQEPVGTYFAISTIAIIIAILIVGAVIVLMLRRR